MKNGGSEGMVIIDLTANAFISAMACFAPIASATPSTAANLTHSILAATAWSGYRS